MNYFLFSQPFRKGTRGIVLLALLLSSFGYGGTSVAYAAPPAHDDFAAAKLINGIEYHDTVNTTEATPNKDVTNVTVGDPDNFLCEDDTGIPRTIRYGYTSIWYKYTPPEAQSLSLDATGKEIGTNIAMDLFIAVWTGTQGNLTLVACNDETHAGFPELSFVANAGTTYYIEIAQYNNGQNNTNVFGGNVSFNAFITNTNVEIGGDLRGRYFIPESGGLRKSFLNLDSGPVEITNVAGNQIIAAERVIYKPGGVFTSFSELMGLPNNQLDTIYWFPWYNNIGLDTQLRIGNVSNSTANVTITIGGVPVPGGSFSLGVGQSKRVSFPGIDDGPVKIVSTQNIVAAERVIYKPGGVFTSFTEMMGLPNSALGTTYWLPWYNNVGLDTQLRIGNVSASPANVTITIGGAPVFGGSFSLGVGESKRVSFKGIDKGPVKIVSTQNIVAAERVVYNVGGVPVSFNEIMALPNNQLDTTYWFPWYNNIGLDTQLRFGNVSTNQTATVHIYVGGQEVTGSPFTLQPGASRRQSFPNIDNGPVRIESNIDIVAAERVIYKVDGQFTSFSEMMGLPNGLLDSKYWMPWYNNLGLDTQLRFALP
jgi:uncharacterized protein YcfL